MNVLVLGAGTMGSVHAQAYAGMPHVHLLGIVDSDLERAVDLATNLNTRAFDSFGAVLAHEHVDVVDICLPTSLHKTYILQAAEAKVHVISEKPITLSVEDARECIDACEAAGVRFFVGQVVRFFPEYRQIQELVQAGELGEIGTVRALRGGAYPHGWNNWYSDSAQSGSLIVDLMIHDFDFLRWCFGEVERVYTKTLTDRAIPGIDHALVSLRFRNGVIAHVEGTWAEPSGFSTELEICGSQGMVHHKSGESVAVQLQQRATTSESTGVAVPASPLQQSPYYRELEHFLACIRDNTEALVIPEDALKALEISLAALASARLGDAVTLPGSLDGGRSA